eukprot:2521376-Pyramimonas_sp.AAC.1
MALGSAATLDGPGTTVDAPRFVACFLRELASCSQITWHRSDKCIFAPSAKTIEEHPGSHGEQHTRPTWKNARGMTVRAM